jgi:iron complex outermembrane receptor protein
LKIEYWAIAGLWLLLVSPFLLVGASFCEMTDGEGLTVRMEGMEVTAQRISDYITNHPQNVEVVGRREIVERGLLSMEEALKIMPGVDVQPSSGIGSRISIRGSGKSSGVLVLLNGRPLNTNQYGGVDLSTIPVEMVESVTVFKPPVPVWLGPGATDGAINIITRDLAAGQAGEKRKATVTAGGGSYGFAEGSASRIVPIAAGNILVTGAGTRLDGKRTNSDKDEGSFSVYWNREKEDGTRYEANGRYYLSEFGAPGPVDNPTPDARQRYEKGSLDGRLAGLLGQVGTYSITPYADLVNMKDRSQTGFTSTLEDVKAGVKSEATWSEKQGLWNLRVAALFERDDIDHSMAGKHHRTAADLSGQYDRRFGPLTGTIGVRTNYTNDFNFNPGSTGGLGYALTEKTLLRGRAGYTVTVPTFGQLYQTSHGSIDQVRGNPNLDEEKTWSYDLGIEHKFGKNRLFQATLFGGETDNLIAYRRGVDKIYRPVNIAKAERWGMEITTKFQWEMGLAVEMNGIFQTSRNGDTGKDLPYTPRMKLKATVQYILLQLKTRLEGTAIYEDARYSETEDLESQRLHPYTVVNVRVIQPFLIKGYTGEWFLKVDNLFDTAYESHFGYPDDGIRFGTGVQMRF